MIRLSSILLVVTTMLFTSGCVSYHRFRPTAVDRAGLSLRVNATGDMSDVAVVCYANEVRDILRKRFHISRNVRQTAATTQILLAGGAGLAGAFNAGATTVATLASGSAAIPQLGEVFDTGGRAIAYQQAVASISFAESAYFAARAERSPVVPSHTLTVEGALLLDAVNAATDAVELFQAGILPTVEQLQRAQAVALHQRAQARLLQSPDRRNSPATTITRRTVVTRPPRTDRNKPIVVSENRGGSRTATDPDPLNSHASSDVTPPTLEQRRDKLKADIEILPSGSAGTILNNPRMDDRSAKDILKGTVTNAEDPALKSFEEAVAKAKKGN